MSWYYKLRAKEVKNCLFVDNYAYKNLSNVLPGQKIVIFNG